MNPAALLMAGVPPSGLGLFARDTVEQGRFAFIAINHKRSDRAAQAAEVRRRGATLWLYSTPEHWQPDTWEATLREIVAACRELGAVGFFANPESEWGSADAGPLGAALAAAASDFRVVVVSYPDWHGLARCAQAAGRVVSGCVEIYGRASNDPEVWARWLASWSEAWGGRVMLAIAGWPATDAMSDSAGFRSYLSRLPKVGGAIVWDASGDSPTYIEDALNEYQPGGSQAGTLALATSAAMRAPGVQATTVILAFVLIVALLR